MKRKIIKINESLCNGCGSCTVGCSEGALQIIDGVAKLVREDFCDGFGDCIGTCPTGALTIEEREAEEFDVNAVKDHLKKTQGKDAVAKMEEAQKIHMDKEQKLQIGGCPGMKNFKLETPNGDTNKKASSVFEMNVNPAELGQWPVQLHLVNPSAPFFKDKELVIMSTCSPVACADIHWKYIRGRSVVVACPKLDRTETYVEKLTEIFNREDIPKIIVLRMTVPCCGGLTHMADLAKKACRRTNIAIEEHILDLEGKLDSKNIL
ncbi:MAG: hypothetical protein KAQ98_07125 [Bacteriovoracaceae bacterium]|nr:hypothetical protein [Bacteriovoracaceae bacterium]